jgi:hypothetical protein
VPIVLVLRDRSRKSKGIERENEIRPFPILSLLLDVERAESGKPLWWNDLTHSSNWDIVLEDIRGEDRMPKLFEYFGLIVLFYSNEHDPIHVHGLYRGMESRAELILQDGKVVNIRYSHVKGRKPLGPRQLRDFRRIVERFQDDIVCKWIEFFVLHKRVESKVIARRLS